MAKVYQLTVDVTCFGDVYEPVTLENRNYLFSSCEKALNALKLEYRKLKRDYPVKQTDKYTENIIRYNSNDYISVLLVVTEMEVID